MLATVMMLPAPCAAMIGTACFIVASTPRKCTAIVLSNWSRSASAIPTYCDPMPALLTRQSSRPNRVAACSIIALTSASTPTSVRTKTADWPSARAASSPRSRRRPAMTTLAPCSTNKLAVCAPMPLVPPVMTATLPSSVSMALDPRGTFDAVGKRRARSGGGLAEEELVVGDDATPVVDDENFEPAGHHGLAIRGKHFPVKRHDIAQRPRVLHGPKAMAAVAHVLLVRSGDALFERVVAARLTRVDKVLTIGRPQLRDREPATACIGLVPHRDIAVGKGLRVTHDILRAKGVGRRSFWTGGFLPGRGGKMAGGRSPSDDPGGQ